MTDLRLEYDMNKIDSDALTGFFVGWPNPPSPADHLALLRGSYKAIVAFDGNKPIAFINAVSDGVLSAYIPLLEVLPDYQGNGIGSLLVDKLLENLSHLYMVDLCCDVELTRFYERFGMKTSTAMIRRNYSAISELSTRAYER